MMMTAVVVCCSYLPPSPTKTKLSCPCQLPLPPIPVRAKQMSTQSAHIFVVPRVLIWWKERNWNGGSMHTAHPLPALLAPGRLLRRRHLTGFQKTSAETTMSMTNMSVTNWWVVSSVAMPLPCRVPGRRRWYAGQYAQPQKRSIGRIDRRFLEASDLPDF